MGDTYQECNSGYLKKKKVIKTIGSMGKGIKAKKIQTRSNKAVLHLGRQQKDFSIAQVTITTIN